MPEFILMQPSTDLAMMAIYARSGWRHVIVDLEHGPHAERDVIHALSELDRKGVELHLKLADLDPHKVGRFFEFGVRHFMLPHSDTVESVRAISQVLQRMPGFDPATTHLCPMIESRQAIESLDAICDEVGVSMLHVGAIDLARDMGFQFSTIEQLLAITPDVMPTILSTLDRIRENGKLNGCLVLDEWRDHLPFTRLDYAAFEIGQIISRPALLQATNAPT